jgi:hypothetical protein
VEAHLVDESERERLACDIRTAHDADGCRARGVVGPGHRLGDPAGHELVARSAPLERLAVSGRHDEDRATLEHRVVAPRPLADVERAASDHERAGRFEHASGDAAVDLVG